MMQRAMKTEKGAARPALKPVRSMLGARSIASPETEQQNQPGLCGPLCNVNLMDLPLHAKAEPNRTGLPDQLKAGIESLSGMNFSDVRVHHNSDKPARLNSMAYAQGHDIHLAPGQEQHLPHEAWHLVQQKMGRVRPTLQANGVEINDDSGLEQEANLMGGKAAAGTLGGTSHGSSAERLLEGKSTVSSGTAVQRHRVVQLLNDLQMGKLGEYIHERIDTLGIYLRNDQILTKLTELSNKYKDKEKSKDLDSAKKEVDKWIEDLKRDQSVRTAEFIATQALGKQIPEMAPQSSASSSSTSTTGKAPQDASSSRSKKKSRLETVGLPESDKSIPEINPEKFWGSRPQSVTASAPFSQSEDTRQPKSEKADNIIEKIMAWKQSGQDGCDGRELNQPEIEHIREWALGIKTKGKKQKYLVIFAEATGDYEGYQMKIIGFGKIGDKNSTFHIRIKEQFKEIFGVAEK